MKIEYKIYYQQETAVAMEVPEEQQTDRTRLAAPHRPQNQLKIKEGRFKTSLSKREKLGRMTLQ